MAKFRYSIVQSTDMDDLAERVNAALEAGGELAGGVSSVGDRHSGCVYHQAILEPVKPARRPTAQAAEQTEVVIAEVTEDAQADTEAEATA